MTQLIKGLWLLALVSPWLWVLGFSTQDLSRGLLLFAVLLFPWRHQFPADNTSLYQAFERSLKVFAYSFPLIAVIFLLARIELLRVGLDMTLFIQVVKNLAAGRGAMTSLLDVTWTDFFHHHADFLLWLPAFVVQLGVSAHLALLLVHGLSLLLVVLLLSRFLEDHRHKAFLLSLVFLLPVMRHSLLWSFHDDILALPFMAAAYLFWRKGQYRLLLANLLILLFVKETMGLWIFGFGLTLFVWERKPWPLLLSLLGAAYFFAYVFLQPILLGKSFDHLSKISASSDLLNMSILWDKAVFFGLLVLPFAFLLGRTLFNPKNLALFFPALPFLGIIFVSNFAEMWKPLNYYGIIPSLVFLLAFLDITKREGLFLTPWKIFVVMAFCFTMGTLKPGKTVVEAIRSEPLEALDFSLYGSSAVLSVTPAVHIEVMTRDEETTSFLGRSFMFEARGKGDHLDGAVFGHEEKEQSRELKERLGLVECLSARSKDWIYLCRP